MEADLVQYVRRAENAEAEIQKLVKELEVAENRPYHGNFFHLQHVPPWGQSWWSTLGQDWPVAG